MPTPRIEMPYSEPFTLDDVLRDGGKRGRLRGWLERDEIVQLHPGVFAPQSSENLEQLRQLYASKQVANGEALVTAAAAAAHHGLATPPRLARSARTSQPLVQVPTEHVLQVGRFVMPSPAWTAIQLARSQPLERALIPLDSALRVGVDVNELRELAQSIQRLPGGAQLGRAAELADPRSESALESISRGLMVVRRLPMPELQVSFMVGGRRSYVDFYWRAFGLIGEADGRIKYVSEEAVMAEKARQSRLQSLGLRVFRWTWDDVYPDPTRWLEGLALALRNSR